MEERQTGMRLGNNVSELTAIAPLIPGTADKLRALLADVQKRPVNPVERIQMIHYARWVIIDQDTRLLFTSNFDGSLEEYLEEFAERDEGPLNAIFGFCVGWPGAKPAGRFIEYVKQHQIRASCFYAAYPRNTVREVKRALHWKGITEQFIQDLDVATAQHAPIAQFLRKLAAQTPEAAQPAHAQLELEDIQSNVLTGFDMGFAKYLFYQMDTAERGRTWLTRLLAHPTLRVTSSAFQPEAAKRDYMVNMALTFQGLSALGVSPRALASFPDEFKQGMAKRAQVLGDHGASDPERWERQLGSPHVHALVVIHGKTADICEQHVGELEGFTQQVGGITKLFEQPVAGLPGDVEHFGFRDGIGQPWIEGTGDGPERKGGGKWTDKGWAPLKAGEFILGYQDESGKMPASPKPDGLGKNGTYLVFRKLQQDVVAFRSFLGETAKKVLGANGTEDIERLGALLMGRWKSGCPVHLSPEKDDPEIGKDPSRNNDFTYQDDPHGEKCPLGAHARRTNPRDTGDTLGSNRHRIIRRGLPYGPAFVGQQDDGKERGTTFIALNASISRQFEFLQQQWINNGEFQGLDRNERDPLMGSNIDERDRDQTGRYAKSPRKFTVPGKPFPWAFNLPDFVTVRGGEYFFLPGLTAIKGLAEGAFSSFVAEYKSLDDTTPEPGKLPSLRKSLVWEWLFKRPKGMFDELREKQPIFQMPGEPSQRIPTVTIATRYDDVIEILTKNKVFTVKKYTEKMAPPRGPFVLGMEDGEQYRRELRILESAISREDVTGRIPMLVGRIADDIITTIKPTGRLDLIEDLAWPLPLRLNKEYFGVPGPDENTLKRWLRDIYTDLFLNLQGNAKWAAAADVAVNEMNAYLDRLIGDLMSAGMGGADTVLGRLIRMRGDSATYMDTEGIRRNILGVTVGVVETTLKAVSRTIDQLLRRPAEMQKATEAARRHDDAMMLKYAFEAMRFNPQNHVIYRWCETPYVLADGTERATKVPANSLVFAATLSAMFDSGKVSDPEVFKPDRPDDNYLFFGHGLHACLGRHLGPMLIQEVVKRVLTLPNLRRAKDDLFDPLNLLPRHFMLEFDS